MPKKQVWTVRVVNWQDRNNTASSPCNNQLPGVWIEQLRYMGHVRELAEYPDRNVVEFYCPDPRGMDTKVWAEQNAARMRSFGIDAAAAPKWTDAEVVIPSGVDRAQHMERLNRPKKTA